MAPAYTPIPIIVPKSYPGLPPTALSLDFVETASGGPVAGDQLGDAIPLGGPTLLLLHSTDAGGTTVSILSVLDQYNRKGDISAYAIGVGLRSAFFARPEGWRDPDGTLHAVASAITDKYAAKSRRIQF